MEDQLKSKLESIENKLDQFIEKTQIKNWDNLDIKAIEKYENSYTLAHNKTVKSKA